MMRRILTGVIFGMMSFLIGSSVAGADDWYERTDTRSLPVSEIGTVSFRDIDFTTFDYSGSEGAEFLTVSVTYRVLADDSESADRVLEWFDIDTDISGRRAIVELEHPNRPGSGFLGWLFRRGYRDWEVEMTVSGPVAVDIDIDADFSTVDTKNTAGVLSLDTDFTEMTVADHRGFLENDIDFGSLNITGLDGGFRINSDFSDIDLELTGLSDDSSVNTSFGDVDIALPADSGAEFTVNESFGEIHFDLSEPVMMDGDSPRHIVLNYGGPRIRLETSFGDITISDRSRSGAARPFPQQAPRAVRTVERPFERGVVSSVDVRGTHLYRQSEVVEMLGIRIGDEYTRDELDRIVEQLEDDRFVRSARYRIGSEGNFTVTVNEEDLYDFDTDLSFSFSRVAGLGLGPRLNISSLVGPLSDLTALGEYHWGNEDWTYHVSGEKRFFRTNTFSIGGSYRRAYESNMDWAVPPADADWNGFLLGLETTNLFQVEGSTATVSQDIGNVLRMSAEYFDEEFSSLEKNTDWSLFNRRHTKAINSSLSPFSLGGVSGMRYAIEVRPPTRVSRTIFRLEAEQALDAENPATGEYIRYLGTIHFSQRLPYRNLLLMRFAGGYADSGLPDQKAFRLGGVNTLRGFDQGMVPEPPAGLDGFGYNGGGNRMVLANIEYHTDDRNDFGLAFFGDIGGVWREGEDIETSDLKRDIGIGLILGGGFDPVEWSDDDESTLRINWAIPVGNVPHKSRWTVNFVRPF